MIDILFFPDYEAGHIFPTFKMAENLKNAGYKVGYLCIPDLQNIVEEQGFDTFLIFEDLYPLGTLKKNERSKVDTSIQGKEMTEGNEHLLHLISGELDELIDQLNPQLLVTSSFIPFEALIMHYQYQLNQIIYSPALPAIQVREEKPDITLAEITRLTCLDELGGLSGAIMGPFLRFLRKAGFKVRRMEDVVEPVGKMSHLLICPKDIAIHRFADHPNEITIGPCIRRQANENYELLSEYLPSEPGKIHLYASMGSQVSSYPQRARKLFELLIECMKQKQFQDYHLVLTVGALDRSSFTDVPENVSLFNWVPQIDLMKHFALAIIHGGLGTTKECIYYGVPMLVVPMARDQFDNGKRVEYNQLGLQLEVDDTSIEELSEKIKFILESKEIQQSVRQMEARFKEVESQQLEVKFISALIGVPQRISYYGAVNDMNSSISMLRK